MNEALVFLTQELSNDDSAIKVNSIYRLKIVVALCNNDTVQSKIIPMLYKIIKDEDDEVHFALAKELAQIFFLVPSQQVEIIKMLGSLCEMEETVIRDQAVNSLEQILPRMKDNEIQEQIIPMVYRFIQNENYFTHRIVGIKLLLAVYPRANASEKSKLREKFFQLGNEETPMVKRALASAINEFAKVIEKDQLIQDIIPLLRKLIQDDQDSVRVICFQNLESFMNLLTKEEIKNYIPKFLLSGIEDKSWKVRLALSKNFAYLFSAFGKDVIDTGFFSNFKNLMTDSEPEVQLATLQSLNKSIDLLSNKTLENLTSLIPDLMNNGSNVKGTLFTSAEMCGILPKFIKNVSPDISKQKILPFLLQNQDDNTLVKIGLTQACGNYLIHVEENPELFNVVKNACRDSKWRVKQEALQTMLKIYQSSNNPNVFSTHFEKLYLGFFEDSVSQIRTSAIQGLETIFQIQNKDTVQFLNTFMPTVEKLMANKTDYLKRTTALYALQAIVKLSKQLDKAQIQIFQNAVQDPVANIRMISAKVFQEIVHDVPKSSKSTILDLLQEIVNDNDKDVKFYSNAAQKVYI